MTDDIQAAVLRRQAAVTDEDGRDHALYLYVRNEDHRGACVCSHVVAAPTSEEFFELFDAHREGLA